MNEIDLYYFRKVAEIGGVRETARKLNVSPSVISRRIARLEAYLDSTLLDKSASGTVLTATGRRCLTYVHEVHAAKQRLQRDLYAAQQLHAGNVSVYCTEGQLEFISRAVTDFQDQFPKIRFDLKIGSAQVILKAVECGEADVGIAFSPILRSPLESAVHILAPLLAIVDPTHYLATRKSVTLEDLEGYALALPPADFAIRRICDQVACKKQVQLNIALCTDSIGAMKAFVRHHGGVTTLSYMSITSELIAKSLVAVPFQEDELKNTRIEIFVLGRRKLPPAVASFLRYLRVHATPAMLSQWMC